MGPEREKPETACSSVHIEGTSAKRSESGKGGMRTSISWKSVTTELRGKLQLFAPGNFSPPAWRKLCPNQQKVNQNARIPVRKERHTASVEGESESNA